MVLGELVCPIFEPGRHITFIIFSAIMSLIQWCFMSHALDLAGLINLLTIPADVRLSVLMGVGGCR